MLIIDIILLIILVGFFFRGWQAGLIKMLAGLIGVVAGIILAGQFYGLAAAWLAKMPWLAAHSNLTNVLSMLVIFFFINGIIGVGAFLVDKIFHIFSFIPFLRTINHLIGALLGLLIGAFIMGFLITILVNFPLAAFITSYLKNSQLVPYLVFLYQLVSPLWPQAVQQFKAVLN